MEKSLKKPCFSLFLALFLVIFAVFEAYGASSDDVYVIEEISVNVESNSPASARGLAFTTARREGFLTLLTRLGVGIEFANNVVDDEIAEIVRSEQVFDEKIIGNRYVAKFKIIFAQDFVDNLFELKKSDQPNIELQKELSFLMIPAEILQKKTLLWESQNQFKKAVEDAVLAQKIANFKIAQADIENLTILNEENVKKINTYEVSQLFTKYGVDIIYITLFSYDEVLKKASILVRGFEKSRQFQYRLSFLNSGDFAYQPLLDKVSQKLVKYLSELKMQDIMEQKLASELIRFYIPIKKLGDFLEVKNKIEASNLVNQMNIEAVSRDYVKLSISYNNAQEIISAFAKIGLKLVPKADNVYMVFVQ